MRIQNKLLGILCIFTGDPADIGGGETLSSSEEKEGADQEKADITARKNEGRFFFVWRTVWLSKQATKKRGSYEVSGAE